jgi:hypothetical protein
LLWIAIFGKIVRVYRLLLNLLLVLFLAVTATVTVTTSVATARCSLALYGETVNDARRLALTERFSALTIVAARASGASAN